MKRQRGVLTFVTPLLMVLVILLGVLALDGARLFSLRKDMQSQVNAAATAAADATQACGGQDVSLQAIEDRALAAARSQGFDGDDGDLVIQPGVIESDDGTVLSFEPSDDLLRSNGVAVSYQRSEPISILLPESTFGDVELTAQSAARKELTATLSGAGSTAVLGGTQQTANLLNTLLGAILNNGTPLSIDPTQFSSLADTTARLGDVLDDLGLSTVEDLAGTDVLVSEVLSALETASEPASDVGGALDQLIAGAGVETVKLSDVIEIVGTTEIPENSRLPLYDTVIALVLNLVEGTLLEGALPSTSIDIDGVTETRLELFVGKAPSVVIGPARQGADGEWLTRFHAPDMGLTVASELNLLGIVDINLPLSVEVGGGDGELIWADCARGSDDNDVTVGVNVRNSVARLATGEIDAGTGLLQPSSISTSVGLPGDIGVLDLFVSLDVNLGGGSEEVELTYNLHDQNPSSAFTSGGLSEADFGALSIDIEILENECTNIFDCLLDSIGNLLSGLVEGVTSILGLERLIEETVEGLVEALGSTVIDPLLAALGVSVGNAQVEVTGADQNNVQLLEYCGPDGC